MKAKRKLVTNDAQRYSTFTCNLLPSGCRMDQLEGRECLVIPMVILTEGVHAGSLGPLYYPKEELSKTPAAWNHKPVVVYHPTMNGEGVSACDPVIINSRKVGVMMNTKFEKGRLKSEAWIEKDRANKVDERIMAAIEERKMMELSTGVFIDVDEKEGEWGKEAYSGVARNFRPDHLALLPDQIGACSIADGAGFLRNAAIKSKGKADKYAPKTGIAFNEMSFSDITSELSDELNKKLNPSGAMGYSCWVVDVFTDYVVYSMNGGLWRLDYTVSDTGITLSEQAPVEVFRVTDYRTDSANNSTNQMNKKKIVAMLMANAVTALAGVTLTDNMTEDQLKTLPDDKLEEALNALIKKPAAAPAGNTAPAPAPAPATPATEKPVVTNAAPAAEKVVTVEDYIRLAPRSMQEVLTNSLSVYNDEKNKLVEVILANKNNSFTKEDLNGRPLGELKAIARLAAAEAPQGATHTVNYGGQAPVPVGNTAEEEVLQIPALTFATK